MREQDLRALFPRAVSVSLATPGMYDETPYPEESRSLAGAVERRRREFAAGRGCARAALARLGVTPAPIPVGARGAPIWPPGYVGAISHCDGLCAAVVSPQDELSGIGLDVEGAEPLPARTVGSILTARELDAHAKLPRRPGLDWAKLCFSAKEAVYKCWFPATGEDLRWHDVEITFDANSRVDGGAFGTTFPDDLGGLTGRRLLGRWRATGHHVVTGVILPNRGQPVR